MQAEITPNVSPDASESKTVPAMEEAAEGRPRKKARVPKIRPVSPSIRTKRPPQLHFRSIILSSWNPVSNMVLRSVASFASFYLRALATAVREKSEVVT